MSVTCQESQTKKVTNHWLEILVFGFQNLCPFCWALRSCFLFLRPRVWREALQATGMAERKRRCIGTLRMTIGMLFMWITGTMKGHMEDGTFFFRFPFNHIRKAYYNCSVKDEPEKGSEGWGWGAVEMAIVTSNWGGRRKETGSSHGGW